MPYKDPEKRTQYHKQYYQKNKTAILTKDKYDYHLNIGNKRTQYYLRMYGITVEQYDELSTIQNHVCKICGNPEKVKTRLAVDHCHTTGKVRGLLCTHCNTALGQFFDDITLLHKAIQYLNDNINCSDSRCAS